MPFSTYILFSASFNRFYFGFCQDMNVRLQNHNKGKVRSTKAGWPWVIWYKEEYELKTEAVHREKFFKSLEGRKWLYENSILKRTD